MSLQVWLPMTKDLRNQGLSDVTVTNNGATFNSAGKLGGCYKTSSTATIDLGYNGNQINSGSISFGGWFKFNKAELWSIMSGYSYTSTRTTPTGNLIGNNSYGGVSLQWYTNNIYNDNTLTTLYVQGYLRSTTNGAKATSGVSLPFDTWVHIFFTFDKLSKVMTIWLNGEAKYTFTNLEFTDAVSRNLLVNYSAVAGGNGPSFNIPFLINDVRIYDHCLSPMEVKQLSQGLVLHYPLNREGWGQENLFSWTNNDTSITLNNYQNTGSFTQFSNSLTFDPSTTVGEKYTISFYARSPNGTTSLMVYNNNGNPQYFNFGSSPQLTSSLGTEWEYFTRTITNAQYNGTGTPSTNTNVWKRIEIYAPNKMGVQVKHIKVEKGEKATPWCPNSSDILATTMGLNSTTEYDCSGFCNNGTRTGTFSWTSDTPKYSVSQYFNGSSYIQGINNLGIVGDIDFTVAFWIKANAWTSDYAAAVWGGIAYDSGTFAICFPSGRISFDFWNKRFLSTSSISANSWHHVICTKKAGEITATNCHIYVDGIEVEGNSNATSVIPNIRDAKIIIGRLNDTSTRYINGNISDIRIYTTALSADDVRALYENSAYIDNSGNTYAATYTEV